MRRIKDFTRLFFPMILLMMVGGILTTKPCQGSNFSNTGSMLTARVNHTSTILPDGKVLIIGGAGMLAIAELYDPSTGNFSSTGSMITARGAHSATLLPNGKVLIVGGSTPTAHIGNAELYDPSTGFFTATGSLNTGRAFHTATLLPNGKVLIVGGSDFTFKMSASAEMYDPTSGTFTVTGSLKTARYHHASTLLADGKVLITGGNNLTGYFASTELYDSSTGSFNNSGNMTMARGFHTATRLSNGNVLIAGGNNSSSIQSANSELFNPATGTFTITGSLTAARVSHTATLLQNGAVLIAGGLGTSSYLTSADLYDPTIGSFNATSNMTSGRVWFTETLLTNGKVLIVGGYGNDGYFSTAELYESSTTVPDAPTNGTAYGGDSQATVTFTAPSNNGGATIENYTVTSNPGGLMATGSASPITVTGLNNGTAYTFTVKAINSNGTGIASAASNSVTPLPVMRQLTVIISGTGGGSVNGDISCNSESSCPSQNFTSGTTVNLIATPDVNSTFSGWTGDCIISSSICSTTMDSAKSVIASFNIASKAMIGSTGYTSFTDAYLEASDSPTIIKMLGDVLPIISVISKPLVLKGGYLPDYSRSTSGYTTLLGSLTIRSGSVVADRIVISAPKSVAILTSTTVTPANPSVAFGALQQFRAMGAYSDNSTMDLTSSVIWSVGESNGGSISSAGLYTAPAVAGTYHILATNFADASKIETVTITVSKLGVEMSGEWRGAINELDSSRNIIPGTTQNVTVELVDGPNYNSFVGSIVGDSGLSANITFYVISGYWFCKIDQTVSWGSMITIPSYSTIYTQTGLASKAQMQQAFTDNANAPWSIQSIKLADEYDVIFNGQIYKGGGFKEYSLTLSKP